MPTNICRHWYFKGVKMKEISCNDITRVVEELCIKANKILPNDVKECICNARNNETTSLSKSIMNDIYENITVAQQENIPVCQDTGMAVVFIELGQDVRLVDGSLEESINLGVKNGYENGLLRKSVVADPLNRVNTNDNTPAIIHTKIVDGENLKITVAPKGFGSENMSAIKMLTPAATRETIIDTVVEIIKSAGANPCPPMVIGVGIGGDFEHCALLAKKALTRPLDTYNQDDFYKQLEIDILDRVNSLDIGPQGFGGITTALKVNIDKFPTHIAGLPLAVNIGCHVTRHATYVL